MPIVIVNMTSMSLICGKKKRGGINCLPPFTSFIRTHIQTTQASWMFFISQSPPAFSTKSILSFPAK